MEYSRTHLQSTASDRILCPETAHLLLPGCLSRTHGLVCSLQPRVHLLICQGPTCGFNVGLPELHPPTPCGYQSPTLMLSSAGNQNTMCVSIKFCHLFVLQTSGRGERKKKKSQLSFHLKKKKGGAQCLILSDLKSALLTTRKCLTQGPHCCHELRTF